MQRGKTESIVVSMTNTETLPEADKQFKRKIYAARGLSIRTDRQGVVEQAVDTSTEEPLD